MVGSAKEEKFLVQTEMESVERSLAWQKRENLWSPHPAANRAPWTPQTEKRIRNLI
jgi:hypothetical protein